MEENEFLKGIIEKMAHELGVARKNEIVLTIQNENFVHQHEKIIAELQANFDAERANRAQVNDDTNQLRGRISHLEGEVNRLNDSLGEATRVRQEALNSVANRDDQIAKLKEQIELYLSTMKEKEQELRRREEAIEAREKTEIVSKKKSKKTDDFTV